MKNMNDLKTTVVGLVAGGAISIPSLFATLQGADLDFGRLISGVFVAALGYFSADSDNKYD